MHLHIGFEPRCTPAHGPPLVKPVWRTIAGLLRLFAAAVWCVAMRAEPCSAQTPPNFKVAFIGDQGFDPDARVVAEFIMSEGADVVVHSGDFDYSDNPAAWEDSLNVWFGADFPYFASVGNHDDARFRGPGGYQEFLQARLNRLGIVWAGDLAVNSYLVYEGVLFLLTGPGVEGSGHDLYIRNVLARSLSIWRISSWHKNMRLMQVGGKGDETGWGVYEESRRGGAIIATAHEHSYSRTHLLSSMVNQVVASTSDTLNITRDDPATTPDEGRSFAFVSGLGGRSIRNQELSGPWWASICTSTQNANYGALFGVFNVGGDPRLAHFYFKSIDGLIVDDFYVRTEVDLQTSNAGPGERQPDLVAAKLVPDNPVTGELVVEYVLSRPSSVRFGVYDVRGKLVHADQREVHAAGLQRWSCSTVQGGRRVPSGVYFVHLSTPASAQTIRAILVDE